MGLLAWGMMGLALWHFTIWLPDRYWGGIVGALIGAVAGAELVGFALSGFDVPARHATDLGTSLLGIPGALIGIAIAYLEGSRREAASAVTTVGLPKR